jgi:outer membrane protein OmpA-like peptidoglycan-associated protein
LLGSPVTFAATAAPVRMNLRDVIHFDTGKATIQAGSLGLLDEVAHTLVTHPEMAKVRIEGHTDSQGDDAKNQTLSQARANAVSAYLTSKGVAAARLEAVGFGETRPLREERTDTDRATNRRVEFFVVTSNP